MTHAQRYPNQKFAIFYTPETEMQPPQPPPAYAAPVKGDNPRELRNKAEKLRRDKLNQSIAQLAAIVPPVLATGRKMDKTSVLRLTAHYLRSHQYVFGDSINSPEQHFTASSTRALLGLLKGFILTTTYKGVVVVASQNVHQYLGYSELDLIGQSIFNFIHEEDRQMFIDQIMPNRNFLGSNGELLIPEEPDAIKNVEAALMQEKRSFVVRIKKFGQRTAPPQYVNCHIEGSFRRSDKACRRNSRCCQQMVRRIRSRGYNTCPAGNDVVFVGLVRPTCETFSNDKKLESFLMEYRTRHSIDGEIIECDSRIALVTGYMIHEVHGVNALNFMHRDDVRWVIVALREMYDQRRLFGESCYRLLTKSGQFIYMQTRGYLDVDEGTRAVTSFVCTNTMVDEQVGIQLIQLMKEKFMFLINSSGGQQIESVESLNRNDSQSVSVEDPRLLEKVILHLVTNLPTAQTETPQLPYSVPGYTSPLNLTIIPHKKERIINAIDKIYGVIKLFKNQPKLYKQRMDNSDTQKCKPPISGSDSESDSLGSLSSLSTDFGGSDCPSSMSEQKPKKRKCEDTTYYGSKKIRRMDNPEGAFATISIDSSLQSGNLQQALQEDDTWWLLEPGPSHQPNYLPEAPSEAVQPQENEDRDQALSQRFCAVPFADNANKCYLDAYECQNVGLDGQLPQVPTGRTCTITQSNQEINNTVNPYYAQQSGHIDIDLQNSVNEYFDNQALLHSSSCNYCVRGFGHVDDENCSENSDVHYLTPNTVEPAQFDDASPSSYVLDSSNGIYSLIPRTSHENSQINSLQQFSYGQFPSLFNYSHSDSSRIPTNEAPAAQNQETLSHTDNQNYANGLDISNALYTSIRDELNSIDISIDNGGENIDAGNEEIEGGSEDMGSLAEDLAGAMDIDE